MGIRTLMKKRAVFLDRDGVLNHAIVKEGKPYPPKSLAELTIPSDVQEALNSLKSAGFLLIGATNQPDVSRGTTLKTTIEAINDKLLKTLPLQEIRVCYHDDKDDCACRKPAPGLLIEAAKEYNIDLQKSIMIGDRWKDILAGERAGCKTIWINHHYLETEPKNPTYVASNMTEAAMWIKKFFMENENETHI